MSRFKCMPILWKNGKRVNWKEYHLHCDHYNNPTMKDGGNKCANDDEYCIWIDETQYALYQAPWIHSVTHLKTNSATEKDEKNWAMDTSKLPANWNVLKWLHKAKNNVPTLISVNLIYFVHPKH